GRRNVPAQAECGLGGMGGGAALATGTNTYASLIDHPPGPVSGRYWIGSAAMDLSIEFLRHNSMMNLRVVEACRPLSPDQLGATAVGTYGSIGATLVHIANAQIGYAARFLHTERPEPLPEDPFPGFDALAERFAQGDANLEQAAAQPGRHHEV